MYVYHYIYRYKILNFVFIGTILERVEFFWLFAINTVT